MAITLKRLDHLVLTVASIERSVQFYTHVLGFKHETFTAAADPSVIRSALTYGSPVQKINLHEKGKEFDPKAYRPLPGSADLCFLSETPLNEVVKHLETNAEKYNIEILEKFVRRTGARGPIESVYIRDPDKNLIEISVEL